MVYLEIWVEGHVFDLDFVVDGKSFVGHIERSYLLVCAGESNYDISIGMTKFKAIYNFITRKVLVGRSCDCMESDKGHRDDSATDASYSHHNKFKRMALYSS
jgi:hypothetical protein